MQSSNPVFARSSGFNGRAPQQSQYGYPTYPGAGPSAGYGEPGYTDPSTWQTGAPGGPAVAEERMTIDSVVMRTAATLAVVVVVAALTWVVMPDELLGPAWMVGAFGGLGVGLVLSFKRKISPAQCAALRAKAFRVSSAVRRGRTRARPQRPSEDGRGDRPHAPPENRRRSWSRHSRLRSGSGHAQIRAQ